MCTESNGVLGHGLVLRLLSHPRDNCSHLLPLLSQVKSMKMEYIERTGFFCVAIAWSCVLWTCEVYPKAKAQRVDTPSNLMRLQMDFGNIMVVLSLLSRQRRS